MQISNIKSKESSYLDHVLRYQSRTFGIKLFKTQNELLKDWKDSMYELCSEYQMQAEQKLKWDFYLILPCLFSKSDMSEKNRFEIESDRFGCRKIIFFNQTTNYQPDQIIADITPELVLDKKVDLITPQNILNDLQPFHQEGLEKFITHSMNEEEIMSFINSIKV